MNNAEPFANPPITEAIFDIRVGLPSEANLEILESFQSDISDQFPVKKNRRKIEGGFRFEDGEQPKVISSKNVVDGFMFHSSDNNKVVQSRLDGFTFNKLKPYSNWEEFSSEATNLWERYCKIAKPEKITRLALRYINRIELPMPFSDFSEYILTIPTLGPTLDFPTANFFTKFVITNEKIGALANIVETIEKEDVNKGVLPFIFDIDVIKNLNMPPDSKAIMSEMDTLRLFKNRIFKESLTDKTMGLFK